MPLEDYYCGDDALKNFASVADQELDAQIVSWDGWSALVAACQGDALLARALLRVIGVGAAERLQSRPAVLDGLTGAECMTAPRGQARLREALMRFPCA